MAEAITARIFRYDPDHDAEPRFQEYRVEVDDDTSVLVLLNKIQEKIDKTLSFRSFCCGLQLCRSCLMRINGKRRFACITQVKPGEQVTIEPLTYPEGHIKDLVVSIMEDEKGET